MATTGRRRGPVRRRTNGNVEPALYMPPKSFRGMVGYGYRTAANATTASIKDAKDGAGMLVHRFTQACGARQQVQAGLINGGKRKASTPTTDDSEIGFSRQGISRRSAGSMALE